MLIQVQTVKTVVAVPDFTKSLIKAWFSIYNSFPSKASIGVIYAQWNVETSGQNCYNFNICNIKAADVPGQEIKYCSLSGVWEIIKGQRVEIPSTNPSSWFRAFNSLDEGVLFYLNFLRSNRYRNAFIAVEQGNPTLFSHLLKTSGYYTANEAQYTAILDTYFNRFMQQNVFETTLTEVQQEMIEITFPSDYQPVNGQSLSATGDVIGETERTENTGLFAFLMNKIKTIFT